MQQNNGDNCLVTNSAAISYSGRTHFVHRIIYPGTLIVFCLNRVIKDVDDVKTAKRAKRAVDFGCGHIGFFSRG